MSTSFPKNDWGVVKKGWDAQVKGEAPHKFSSAGDALKKLKRMQSWMISIFLPL
jgi:hypothetical protein